jgi:hypothetical protein
MDTGLPSGPSIPLLPAPNGEFIIPGSRLPPSEPSPESGPGPIELGVEQGVDCCCCCCCCCCCVSCCDIWAIEEIGSKPPFMLPSIEEEEGSEEGVPGFSGMLLLSCSWDGSPDRPWG